MRCGERLIEASTRLAYQGVASLMDVLNDRPVVAIIAERVIDHLSNFRTFIVGVQQNVKAALDVIADCDIDRALDPTGEMVERLAESEAVIKSAVSRYEEMRNSAFQDPGLSGEHETRVVRSFANLIDALKELHDAVSNLRWAIMEHDADFDSDLLHGTAQDVMSAIARTKPGE
jgi:hypothetical protein